MLTEGLAYGLTSAFLEVAFCTAIPLLHRIISWNRAMDIAFSCMLTFLIGGGSVKGSVVFGGLLANAFSSGYWHYEPQIVKLWSEREARLATAKQYAQDLWKVFIFVVKVVTLPLRIMRWGIEKYESSKASALSLYASLPFTNRKATTS